MSLNHLLFEVKLVAELESGPTATAAAAAAAAGADSSKRQRSQITSLCRAALPNSQS